MKLSRIKPLIFGLILLITAGLIYTSVNAASVTITPDFPEKSGLPGSIVTYSLKITNSGATDLNAGIQAISTGGWTAPVAVPNLLVVPAGGQKTVTLNVPIPDTTLDGQNDITTIYVTDKDNADAVVATGQVRTTVDVPEPPAATKTPKPTSVPGRPVVTIASYSTGSGPLYGGDTFTLEVRLGNDGQLTANNVVIIFDGADFYPQETGGVIASGEIPPGDTNTVKQKFIIGDALTWANYSSIKATVTYSDDLGATYSETFNISVGITEPQYSSAYYTPTPNIPLRPQLIVTGYQTDIDPLQPGSIFELALDVKNLGKADAKNMSVVLGGGVSAGGDYGTPQPGGVSGSSGDLANFAPLGSSNVIFVGDVVKDDLVTVTQKLVVNVSTQPGAYSLKLSFVYNDAAGNRLVDDQVITLLVYSLPQVEVSFYRDAGMFTAGMENILPLQVTNLGKKTYVLGNMRVSAENADLINNTLLVGALDPGGYYTLDTSLIPYAEGPLDLKITIKYTDDFNQLRTIEQVIPIEVQPEIIYTPDPGMEGEGGIPGEGFPGGEPAPETFWQKVLRFFKGLFGLDSGLEQPVEVMPTEDINVYPIVPKG